MTINERVRELRKEHLHITLDQFGDRVGLKKSALSLVENGRNAVTDQLFLSICREFKVNETWLRDGEGEIFVQRSRNEQIIEFMNDVMEDVEPSFRKRFVEVIARLDYDEWVLLEKMARQLLEESKED